MCKKCAEGVHSLLKNRGTVYNLCAALRLSCKATSISTLFSTDSTQHHTPYLYPVKNAFSNLLVSYLYPLSTSPITKPINFIQE